MCVYDYFSYLHVGLCCCSVGWSSLCVLDGLWYLWRGGADGGQALYLTFEGSCDPACAVACVRNPRGGLRSDASRMWDVARVI